MCRTILVTVLLFSVVAVGNVQSFTKYPQTPEIQQFQKIIKECTQSVHQIGCFADRTARAIEKTMDWDISLFNYFYLLRNQVQVMPITQARTQSGFGRLVRALRDFLNTHTLTLDLIRNDSNPRNFEDEGKDGDGGGGGGGGSGGGGGGGGKGDMKGLKKEKGYMQYAFMVLLGIFGLTGPLIMKTLAAMAAHALIASKIAMIIVGSVALKKIFEKDHEQPSVKVHTIHTGDEHDRVFGVSKLSPYWAHQPISVKPT